ncbi:hypothetical protein ACQP0C_05905 [Nocardia sp. CA-129566]|uniref:hypothetical protein n=1 Tax=Nocardia sp. CA-129566 TaxID=3239976 RepID=UPI003D963A0D
MPSDSRRARDATARGAEGASPTVTGRLSVVDEIFLRTHRGLGTPIALQGLWRTADRVDPALLRQVHAALRVGPLGRRVIRPRVPGARRSWRPNSRAYPLEFTKGTIAHEDLLTWADQQGADLDPEHGPGWRLSAAALDDGGSIVSLSCSHALADGRALVLAVDDALGGTSLTAPAARTTHSSSKATAPEPDHSDIVPTAGSASAGSNTSDSIATPNADAATTAAPEWNRSGRTGRLDSLTRQSLVPEGAFGSATASTVGGASGRSTETESMATPRPGAAKSAVRESDLSGKARRYAPMDRAAEVRAPESDWSDAWRQWSVVVRGTFRALRRGIPERPTRAVSTRECGVSTSEHGMTETPSVILQCSAADWELAAAAQGGTANSLFIALIAKMLWASGFPRETIGASLPVDTRDEPRVDNDLAMTEISIDRADTAATIREKSRIAYERRMSSPGGMPEELLQVIPDRWAYALSRGAGERDILCSNIGTLPDSLRTLGPHRCTGVAARAIHPGLTADHLPRTRLSGYLCRIADTYTLAIVSLDPDRIASPETLRNLVHETTTALLLPITLW